MPYGCRASNSTVLIYGNVVTVITPTCIMSYKHTLARWTVKQYDKIGDKVSAVIHEKRILASVYRNRPEGPEYTIASYDTKNNRWNTEVKEFPEMWKHCNLFMFTT